MPTDTTYLGLRLPHPFIAGASPFGYRVDSVKRLEDAGCAAVVLHSLFEEQVAMAQERRVAHMSWALEFAGMITRPDASVTWCSTMAEKI